MADREQLPSRRGCENFNLECLGQRYTATIGRFADGRIAEIFLAAWKAGSDADANARDSAVVCSIALQYGVPLDIIRPSLARDTQGKALSPLGVALDKLAVR